MHLEAKGGEGADDRNEEDMDVSDEDNGALVGNLSAEATIHKRAPLGGVKKLVSIGDKAVALEIRAKGHEEHAEHCVAAVPALSVGGHTDTAASELGISLGEFSDGIAHGVLGHHDA